MVKKFLLLCCVVAVLVEQACLVAQAGGADEAALTHSEAGAIALENTPGFVCDGVLSYTGDPNSKAGVTWSAKGTDNATVLIAALAQAGSIVSPLLGPGVDGVVSNAPGKVVRLPHGKVCVITRGIPNIPPGVMLDGNNSTLYSTGPGNVVQVLNVNANHLYGRSGDSIRNLDVMGPGHEVSRGACILVKDAVHFTMENVVMSQCKYGLETQGVEYSHFSNVWGTFNAWGYYATNSNGLAGPSLTDSNPNVLPSIDNVFVGGGFERNYVTGIRGEAMVKTRFFGTSTSFNRHKPIVEGIDFSKFIDRFELKTPGSCPPDSLQLMQISDVTGTRAQGFIRVNAKGKAVSAWSIEGGMKYTAPAVKVLGCTVSPEIAAHVQDDSGLGFWKTQYTAGVGSNLFLSLDMEGEGTYSDGSSTRPSSGYGVFLGPNVSGDRFESLNPFVDQAVPERFWKPMLSMGSGINYIDQEGGVANPITGSKCQIISYADGGIMAHWLRDDDAVYKTCDQSDHPITDYRANWEGWYVGMKSSSGFEAFGGAKTETGFGARVLGDRRDRIGISLEGDVLLGSGSANADVVLGRSAEGLLGLKAGAIDGSRFDVVAENGNGGTTPAYVKWVYSEDKGSTAGIPAASLCEVKYRWAGSYASTPGTAANALYVETASCVIDGQGERLFRSEEAVRGGERFTPSVAPAKTGTRFVCVGTDGVIRSSVTACSGT